MQLPVIASGKSIRVFNVYDKAEVKRIKLKVFMFYTDLGALSRVFSMAFIKIKKIFRNLLHLRKLKQIFTRIFLRVIVANTRLFIWYFGFVNLRTRKQRIHPIPFNLCVCTDLKHWMKGKKICYMNLVNIWWPIMAKGVPGYGYEKGRRNISLIIACFIGLRWSSDHVMKT